MAKEQILEIADRQMKLGGYDALNFREISEELNISKANVHHHFKTKEILALEVANHYALMFHTQITTLGDQMAPDYIGFITQINEMFWMMSKEAGNCRVCVCSQIIKDENVPQKLVETAKQHFNTVNRLLIKYAQLAIDKKTIKTKMSAQEVGIQTQIVLTGIMSIAMSQADVKSAKKLLGNQINLWLKNLK
jgi:TetR/AcrR family transcriptional repressor of nem operon